MSVNQIIFDAEYISQQVKNLESARSMLEEAITMLKQASSHEGWKCPEIRNIRNSLSNINSKLGRINSGMESTARVLTNGMQRFQELETCSETQANFLSGNLKEQHGFTGSNYGQNDQTNLPVTYVPEDNSSIALIKPLLSWAEQTKTSDTAGLGKAGLSYLESLYNFYTGDKCGLTGAKDLCDLGDKSINFYNKYYSYLKNFYNGAGNTFSIANQKIFGGLGIVGSSLGLVSSAFGIVDNIISGNLGPAGITGEVIGAGSNVIDIWGSIEKFKHIGETTPNFVKGEGIYSPLTLWTASAKGVTKAVSQGFKSYEKYAADGSWDMGDTARTGIESGITGLYSMVDTLSFGSLSTLGKVTGFTPENISADIENWSDNIGKRAGNYIINDPSLYKTYKNSGPIVKTVITFHAAFQSGLQSTVRATVNGFGNWFKSLFH